MKQFEDALDTAVFTTRFVMKDKKVITYVTHDIEDGAWQFFSADNFEDYEDVIMIVGLGEMISIDQSILDIADLPLGYSATRQSIKDPWIVSKI